MSKKYKLTNETKNFIDFIDHELHKIKSLSYFSNATKDSFGGYIEKEDNLSQEGDCWVYDNAMVYGNARVYGDSRVYGNAIVFGNAIIYGDSRVCGDAIVSDNARVYGNARVFGNASICDNAMIYDNAIVYGNAIVFGNAIIYGNARVCGNASIGKNAYITSTSDYIVIGPIGSRLDYTTFYLDKDRNIYVQCGCYNGTIDEFKDRVIEVHNDNKYAKQYLSAILCATSTFDVKNTNDEKLANQINYKKRIDFINRLDFINRHSVYGITGEFPVTLPKNTKNTDCE